MADEQWTRRWGYDVATKASKEGVWRLRSGGYIVRVTARDPKSGKRVDTTKAFPEATLQEAVRERTLLAEEAKRRAGGATKPSKTLFATFAAQLFDDKVRKGDLQSAATRDWWADVLEHHLVPVFGHVFVEDIDVNTIEEAKKEWAERIEQTKRGRLTKKGEALTPNTANGWLRVFRVIMKAAKTRLKLPTNPAIEVPMFTMRGYRTYTREDPNTLRDPATARKFLACMRTMYPQFYAMTVLGLVTGARPSMLRPLRKSGRTPDVLWAQHKIIFRRSHTLGQEIMDETKTALDIEVTLPKDVMDVLHWHVHTQTRWKRQQESEFLFPAARNRTGNNIGLPSRTALDKPFKRVSDAIGLGFRLTPHGMRRTFKDLARQAGLSDEESMAISGHMTEEMHEHYQTVTQDEVLSGLTRLAGLLGPAENLQRPALRAVVGGRTGGGSGGGRSRKAAAE